MICFKDFVSCCMVATWLPDVVEDFIEIKTQKARQRGGAAHAEDINMPRGDDGVRDLVEFLNGGLLERPLIFSISLLRTLESTSELLMRSLVISMR